MDPETKGNEQEQGQEQEPELTEEQAEAEFEAAFRRARGEEAPESDPPPTQGAEGGDGQASQDGGGEGSQESGGGEAGGDGEGEGEQPVLAGYTEQQIRDLLDKAQRVDELERQLQGTAGKVFGKFGEVQRALQELQQRRGTSQSDSQEERAAQITADKLKRLHDEYPDIAELLAGDLSEVMGSGNQAGQSVTPDQLDEMLNERMQQVQQPNVDSLVTQRVEERLLSFRHPDWREVANSEAFHQWQQSLPQAEREKLDATWDSDYIAQKLDEFKKAQQPSQESSSQQRSTSSKHDRLRNNVQPRGAANTDPPAMTDEQAFEFGFKRARGES